MTRKMLMAMLGIFLFLPSAKALELGIGPYAEYGYGTRYIAYNPDDAVGRLDLDADVHHLNAGVVLDTGVGSESLFNYRLALAYRKTWLDPRYPTFDRKFDADGFSMDNVLGLGVARKDMTRFWVGPSVRLAVDTYGGEDTFFPDPDDPDSRTVARWQQTDLNVGVGAEAGLNISLKESVAICISAGYQYTFVFSWMSADTTVEDDLDDYSQGEEHLLFLNLAVLLRDWDFGVR